MFVYGVCILKYTIISYKYYVGAYYVVVIDVFYNIINHHTTYYTMALAMTTQNSFFPMSPGYLIVTLL